MARYKKKDYLAVVELLEQVNKRLSQCDMRSVDTPTILSDCQEAAITLGTNLEQQGEEGIRLTHILEAYCETLYQFSQKLAEGTENKACADYIQTMASQLAELEEGICKNLPERKEVVFLPYKASMWDSLESVWMAADKDSDCDAYVIPIPYFERNSDYSFGEQHYEGNQFPSYVPITPYSEYSIPERRPDIIFVHNPYDADNYVTSVHPDFYNNILCKYTDLLVYVEYGIPLHIFKTPTPYDNFIPGWFYFDVYCTYSKEYARNQKFAMQMVKPDLKTDIVALGSPKFDKVLKSNRADFNLPRTWKNIIGERKVVLFNTSLNALLKDTERYLLRLTEILEIFRNTKELVLWWRPHPLSLSTVQSMRPDLVERYKHITNMYKQDAWGIYDESEDLHRAIAYTDAYYGDESSVVYLYCATGKPFTICGTPHQSCFMTESTETFEKALQFRIYCMESAKGANIDSYNVCMWWGAFYEDLDYKKFLKLFLDYVAHKENYSMSELYEKLQIKMFREFVVNWDGTAGKKIYKYCKRKV